MVSDGAISSMLAIHSGVTLKLSKLCARHGCIKIDGMVKTNK